MPYKYPILGKNKLISYHLPSLGSFLDVCNQFLLLICQLHSLSIQFSNGLVKGPFVLPEEFCKRKKIKSALRV